MTLALPLAALLGIASAQATPHTYRLIPAAGSEFTLAVEKTGLLAGKRHVFLFPRYNGALSYDPDKPSQSRVQFTVDAGSFQVQDDWVNPNDRLKIHDYALSDKMLDTAHHPQLTFTSSQIVQVSDGRFNVTGPLKIRDRIQPATIAVALTQRSDGSLFLTGRALVKLSDYDLKRPSAALGAVGTKDTMTVSFRMAAQR